MRPSSSTERGCPFRPSVIYPIGELRETARKIVSDRRNNPALSARFRTQLRTELPWAKSWNEEFYPLKLFADHIALVDSDTFQWTPEGAADFTIRASTDVI
jgi:hypothetical protein